MKEGFQTLTGDTFYNLLARTWFVTTLAARTAKRLFWVATCPAKTQEFKCHGRRGGNIFRDNERSLPPVVWLKPAGVGEPESQERPGVEPSPMGEGMATSVKQEIELLGLIWGRMML